MNKDLEPSVIEQIEAAAIIVASGISEIKYEKINNDNILYRMYRDAMNKYFNEVRNNSLFNGQTIGDAKSLVEEKREKEVFMTYLFWPNDEEFLSVQMDKSEIIEKMLEGVNIRAAYINQKKEKVSSEKKVASDPKADLEKLAQQAVVSFKSLQTQNHNFQTTIVEKDQRILELQEVEQNYHKLQDEYKKTIAESEQYRISSNKYIDELLDQINVLQEENKLLAQKAYEYDEIIPSIKSALEAINTPESEETIKGPER